MSWPFPSGGIGVSASASNQSWFDLLEVQGALKSLLQHSSKASILITQLAYGPTLTSIHDYWKNHSFDYPDLCWQSGVSAF